MGYIGSDPVRNDSVSTAQLADDAVTGPKIVDNIVFTNVTASAVSASGTATANVFSGSDGKFTTINIGGGSITGITDLAVADGGTGASTLNDLITLTTHTTGNYVATITGGTNLTSTAATSGEGTTHTLNVDDAFLVNDASDTTSGTITAAGFTTTGNISGSVSQAIQTGITTVANVTTVGALDAGSITSNFGSIDNGASAITTTGLISGGSLDIDDVVINGTTIGHTNDTDLLTVANGKLTVAGDLEVQGTTTEIDSTILAIGDRIVELNAGSAAGDGGLYIRDADTAETGSLLWDVSADRWIGGLKDNEVTIPTISSTDTLTNKSIDLDSNTLSGTLAEFNTALQSESFVSLTGTETLTNKTLTSPTLTTPALGTPASGTATNITGLPIVAGTTGTLSVARGGTGVTTSTGTGNTVLSASPTFTGTIAAAAGTFSGNVSGSSESTASFGSTNVMGNLNIGTTSSNPSASVATSGSDANLTISGSIFPEGDNNHDLGSANYRWRYIYTTDLKLSNEGTGGNSVDGTEGNWTVEEGEEDLFVTNKKSGKKFRIKLEEIE